MASSSVVTATAPALEPPQRKRRRSHEPDWNNFYRNGLPREVIVIDDSPEPEANTSRKIANGHSTAVAAPQPAADYDYASTRQQPAKKRRRDDDSDVGRAAGYHVQYIDSHSNTSVGSSGRSTGGSGLHTTGPTSLSSSGRAEDAQVPAKRKRSTRQQAANEAKRRDTVGLGGAFLTYKPPPFPPKKAGDVHVRVANDVSFGTCSPPSWACADLVALASPQQCQSRRR